MNVVVEGKHRRVQITQQTVADRGLAFDRAFDFFEIESGARDHGEHAKVVELAGRDVACFHQFGPAEKESLEIVETVAQGFTEFFLSFDFFGQHGMGRAQAPHHIHAFGPRGGAQVDFDDVGERKERFAGIVGGEIIERDEVSGASQTLAGRDDFVVNLDAFENLDDGEGRRKQRDHVIEQHFAGAVDEGATMITQRVDTEQQGTVECATRSGVDVSLKRLFRPVSKEQFISEHSFVAVKDGLARNEADKFIRVRAVGEGVERLAGSQHV